MGVKETVVVKRSMVLMGTLALLVFAIGLSPAVAQQEQYGGEEVSATGYLSPVSPAGVYSHLLNDEATGQQYSSGARRSTSVPTTTARRSPSSARLSRAGVRRPSWR